MPHTNKASAPVSLDIPELEGRYVDLGGYAVALNATMTVVGANLAVTGASS